MANDNSPTQKPTYSDALDGAYNAAYDAAQLALEAMSEGDLRLARVALRAALEAVGEMEALLEGRAVN